MAEPRLKAGLWVKMALRMADRAGTAGVVLRKGDADSGGVLVVLRGREGMTVLSQVRAADGALAWMRGTGAAAVDQEAADAYVGAAGAVRSRRLGAGVRCARSDASVRGEAGGVAWSLTAVSLPFGMDGGGNALILRQSQETSCFGPVILAELERSDRVSVTSSVTRHVV